MNDSKTEYTILKRGDRNTEKWRNTKKLGSLLGDREDIARRKQLAITAMRNMNQLWIDKHKRVKRNTRIQLMNALVKSTLLYNSSTWGLSKDDEKRLNSFHRRLLRRTCKINWKQNISSKALYKMTKSCPISIDITKSRWKYLGHVLRMPANSPPKQSMEWFFTTDNNMRRYRGGQRATILTTLQRDIGRALRRHPDFQIKSLEYRNDLHKIIGLASDRTKWKRISKVIVDTAKAEAST